MTTGRLSIVIPSRNEQFLQKTVQDLLGKARGDVELVVVLEGYWPNPPLPDNQRLKIIHFGESKGMRPAINAAVATSTGEFILKADAHTMWDEGFDLKLKAEYHEDNWIVVPRRHALEPETWTLDTSNSKYPVDYHYLSYPFERVGDPTCGLHGTPWTPRREERKYVMLDDEMSSQGSAWFMSRRHWNGLGPMEIHHYGNFIHEFQELGLKTWLGGGAVKVNKNTWYAHLYKGKRYGRGYSLGPRGHLDGSAFCTNYWMNDRWPDRVRNLRWLIEKFSPVPTWPTDLDKVFSVSYTQRRSEMEVVSARYGVSTTKSVDVTEAIRKMLKDDGLTIKVSNESLGVGPVYPGQRKRLVVVYKESTGTAEASALERKTLRINPTLKAV